MNNDRSRLEAANAAVKQLQTGSISVEFDGLKKRESINNRIDGFTEVH